jgi:hypothetical protein
MARLSCWHEQVYVRSSNVMWGTSMSDRNRNEPMSRRAVARQSLRVLLAAGLSVVGLSLSTKKAHAGYGECSVYGCNCKAYMGENDTCNNCGHSFKLHW